MSSIEKFINKLDKTSSKKSSGKAPSGDRHHSMHEYDYHDVDVDDPTNFSSVVKIDFALLEEQGMLVPNSTNNRLAEEYRAIKRPLLNNAFGKTADIITNGNLIMISSAFPGEGKSFSAINLAISMASERDRTVLLVEADVAKPSVCKYIGIDEPNRGLIDYIENPSIGLSNILLRTNIPKLSILPAGRFHQHATELLASSNMETLMDELAHRYPDRVVLFDSPPLLVTSEAVALSELMGQLVLVVESGKTQRSVVKDALAKLKPELVVGVLLNKIEGKGSGYGGYYSVGGYGGYGGGGV